VSRKRYLIVESPSGRGKIYNGDELIAEVRYSLRVKQGVIISKAKSGTSELPVQRNISGQIWVRDEDEKVIKGFMDGSILTLHLADGRKWKFIIKASGPRSGEYQVVNASKEGLTD
jgi:hypothetical protein